jgi:hypothetical protein
VPFMLYDTARTRSGKKKYTKLGTVSIAGNRGPLASLHEKKNLHKKSPFKWHAPAAEIVGALKGDAQQEILINLKPNGVENVSLYRLLDVWGFSYDSWTPLAIRLEVLFSDRRHKNPEEFMKSFEIPSKKRGDFIGEFLYLRGGSAGGSWNWGQVGRVNGALLWRDAFDFLCESLREKL